MIPEKAMQADFMRAREGFQADKALAAVSYLVSKTGESLYPVMKMMYLADKCHLERFGRLIAGDTYTAMEKGPCPSATYDLLKFARGDRSFFSGGESAKETLALSSRTHQFKLLKAPEVDALSLTDLECLDEVIEVWRTHGPGYVRDASHDQAWEATSRNANMELEAIAAQFDDGPAIVQHLANRFPG